MTTFPADLPGRSAESDTDSFAGLSLADVLDARDAYHVHLVRQRHVMATAVGRYLVRIDDDDTEGALSLAERLTLPPGRRLNFPSTLFGGGYVCLTEVQGIQRVGTVACVVSDGIRSYAPTNRHVAGRAGQRITSLVGGLEVPLGVAAARSVWRMPFERASPALAARRAEVAVDAGLIEIDDISRWTTQVFGIGQLGPSSTSAPRPWVCGWSGNRSRPSAAPRGRCRARSRPCSTATAPAAASSTSPTHRRTPGRPATAAPGPATPARSGQSTTWNGLQPRR
jgi:hypothetical protein